MPTVNEVVGGWLDKAGKHPKSTMQAVLTAVLAIIPIFVLKGWMNATVAASLVAPLTAYKVYLGGTQSDGDKQEAKVPGSSKTEMVPGHLVPDDPANVAVPSE